MAADRYNLFAYWNSRTSIDPQFSLQSGLPTSKSGATSSTSRARPTATSSGSAAGWRRRVGPEHPGQHQRHADEPGQRRPERQPLLDLRAGGVQAHPAAPRGGRAPVGRRRPLRPPVLAQGRPGLQPQREPLVPVLGEQGVPDAQLLGVLPPGAGGGAVDRARYAPGDYPGLLPADCREPARPDTDRPDDDPAVELRGRAGHRPYSGARARQRQPQGREGHRVGARVQRQSFPEGLRHG